MHNIGSSRARLLNAIGRSPDITFIRSWGNISDQLIYAGTRQLLAKIPYVEVSLHNLASVSGHTAILSGGGAWCQPFHEVLPAALPIIEERFERVIVMPSSFDITVDCVRDVLAKTKAVVFARERISLEQIRGLCHAEIAYDCAFFFDYRPYKQGCGDGRLKAYRTDSESRAPGLPSDNRDISVNCESLDEWLWTISRHEIIETDRAHVMIAAALLGKGVEYQASSYHKVPAIAQFSLKGLPVNSRGTVYG